MKVYESLLFQMRFQIKELKNKVREELKEHGINPKKDLTIDTSIAFSVPLSKVQIFKLKKQLSENEQIFVTPIDGEDFDISI